MRAGAFFCITSVLAVDDEYHHTQLLQTKVNHPKMHVHVDANADVDESVLFQTKVQSMGLKSRARRVRMEAARKRLAHKLLQFKKGPPPGPMSPSSFGSDEELRNKNRGPMPPGGDMPPMPPGGDVPPMPPGGDLTGRPPPSSYPFTFSSYSSYFSWSSSTMGKHFAEIANNFDHCMGRPNIATAMCQKGFPEEPLHECFNCGMACCPAGPKHCTDDCMGACMEGEPMEEFINAQPPPPSPSFGDSSDIFGLICTELYGEMEEADMNYCKNTCAPESLQMPTFSSGPPVPSSQLTIDYVCSTFYPEDQGSCVDCEATCHMQGVCEGKTNGECLTSEAMFVCHSECMGSPLVDTDNNPEKACSKHYPGREVPCLECGGHCHADFPCDSVEECMNNGGFMDCHHDCMHNEDLAGEDPAERACKDYYPDAVGQCLECGRTCAAENNCEGDPHACATSAEFHHCHIGCMMDPEDLDPAIREECEMAYGEDVDVKQCFDCGFGCLAEVPPEMWEKEPSFEEITGLVESMMQCSDQCMGRPNKITQGCQEQADANGVELDLAQCVGCGMMCGCDGNHCDLECHHDCMGFGSGNGEEGGEMCKEFYGEDVDVAQCVHCAEGEEGCAHKATMETDGDEIKWFEIFQGCMDDCLDRENAASKFCKKTVGPQVELSECFACGASCCDSFDDCKSGAKDDCVKDCVRESVAPERPGSRGGPPPGGRPGGPPVGPPTGDGTDLIQLSKAIKK